MTGALDDHRLACGAGVELVRATGHGRRRRRIVLAVAAVAALFALPASVLPRTLPAHTLGGPARPEPARLHRPRSPYEAWLVVCIPPRYVAGVRTARGVVLLWAARRQDGTQCTGIEAAFGDADVVRLKLARRTIAGNGITCGSGPSPIDSGNVGLTNGQGQGSVHVEYGQVPARVQALRVTFEDGHSQAVIPEHGWVVVAFEQGSRRPGHRPILEQALDARDHLLATKRLNPWDYGGKEPPLPALDGPGSTLLATVPTPSGSAQLRLSAPGRAWQRQQCWGVILDRRSTPVFCSYPAALDPRVPRPPTNNLFLWGPSFPGLVIAIATRADHAWLVAADHSVRPGRILRLTLAGSPELVIAASARRGRQALAGIVTSRHGRIAGALLMASRRPTTTAPCFLAAPSAGAPPATAACRALMATARRATGLS